MTKDLILYKDLVEAELDLLMFGGVTFLRDFGPWQKGEQVDCLAFELEKGIVTSSRKNGDDKKECKFTLQALV